MPLASAVEYVNERAQTDATIRKRHMSQYVGKVTRFINTEKLRDLRNANLQAKANQVAAHAQLASTADNAGRNSHIGRADSENRFIIGLGHTPQSISGICLPA